MYLPWIFGNTKLSRHILANTKLEPAKVRAAVRARTFFSVLERSHPLGHPSMEEEFAQCECIKNKPEPAQ